MVCVSAEQVIILSCIMQVTDFVYNIFESTSFYGLQANETLDSLVLDFVSSLDYKYKDVEDADKNGSKDDLMETCFIEAIINTLKNSGFKIPKVSDCKN